MSDEAPGGGPVVLDVGIDAGALIVHLDAERAGSELHLRREGDAGSTIHTCVWPRRAGERVAVVAVFPSLSVGRWAVLDDAGRPSIDVVIEPEVAVELDIRSTPS